MKPLASCAFADLLPGAGTQEHPVQLAAGSITALCCPSPQPPLQAEEAHSSSCHGSWHRTPPTSARCDHPHSTSAALSHRTSEFAWQCHVRHQLLAGSTPCWPRSFLSPKILPTARTPQCHQADRQMPWGGQHLSREELNKYQSLLKPNPTKVLNKV